MSWGDLYNRLRREWYSRSLDDRLRSRGWLLHPASEGPAYWERPVPGSEGFLPAQAFVGDNNDDGAIAKYLADDLSAGGWNPRDFVEKYQVLPLDDPYSGNGTYDDARVVSQGRGNLCQFLSYVSGDPHWQAGRGGQIVDDPALGRVWVPHDQYRGSFDPYRDFSK